MSTNRNNEMPITEINASLGPRQTQKKASSTGKTTKLKTEKERKSTAKHGVARKSPRCQGHG